MYSSWCVFQWKLCVSWVINTAAASQTTALSVLNMQKAAAKKKGKICSPCPWWIRSSWRCPCSLRGGVGLDDLERSLPTQTICWFYDSVTRSGLKSQQGRFRLQIKGTLSSSEGQLWDGLWQAGVELSPEVWRDKMGECPLRKGSYWFFLGAERCPTKDFFLLWDLVVAQPNILLGEDTGWNLFLPLCWS